VNRNIALAERPVKAEEVESRAVGIDLPKEIAKLLDDKLVRSRSEYAMDRLSEAERLLQECQSLSRAFQSARAKSVRANVAAELARVLYRLGREKEAVAAEADFRNLSAEHDAAIEELLGYRKLEQGKTKLATQHFEGSLGLAKNASQAPTPFLIALLGKCGYLNGEYSEGGVYFSQAAELCHELDHMSAAVKYHKHAATCFHKAGNNDRAYRELKFALEVTTTEKDWKLEHAGLLDSITRVLIQSKRWDEAIATAESLRTRQKNLFGFVSDDTKGILSASFAAHAASQSSEKRRITNAVEPVGEVLSEKAGSLVDIRNDLERYGMLEEELIRLKSEVENKIVGRQGERTRPWGKKLFNKWNHEFGTVARAAKAEYVFEMTNPFKEDIHIHSVRTSCGCATATILKDKLETHEKGGIHVRYNTRTFTGRKGATVTVVIDQPYYTEVQLPIDGYIRSDIVFNPGLVSFGSFGIGSKETQEVEVAYAGRDDWEVVDVQSASPHFNAELKETRRDLGRVNYKLVVETKGSSPVGYFTEHLILVTNDVRATQVPIRVEGNVVADLQISPASIYLGQVDLGQSVKKTIVVRSKNPFELSNASSSLDGIEVRLKESEKKGKSIHLIPVVFQSNTLGRQSGVISVTTTEGLKAECKVSVDVRDH